MDPLTQGALGAALPQSLGRRGHALLAGALGFVSGMAPDLDVLIRSPTDPLLFLEYHRQFTHALVFIPIGGLLCAALLHPLLVRGRFPFRRTYLYCTLGYATHGLLDACTTYGTLLLWPFSDERFAWNTISIIDPLFTLPLLGGILLAARRRRPLFARMALAWCLLYMGLGLVQRDNAAQMGWELAHARGHEPLRLEAKPSFANILVWKVVYETRDRFYVDAVRAGVGPRVFPGSSVARLDVDRDMPWLQQGSQQAQDIERFRWFSNGYIARDPVHERRVIDIRYSLVPNEVKPLWSLELRPGAGKDEHAAYSVHREADRGSALRIWDMLTARQGGAR